MFWAAGCGVRRRWWYQYPPLLRAAGSSLVASHSWVRCPSRRSSGAPGPPILVGTQPGSTALLYTSGQMRATATARAVTNSLLSEYEPVRASSAPVHAGHIGSPAVVHAAAEVYEPVRAIDEGGKQVRSDDVDRHDLPAAVDAGVVDHRVNPAELVDLVGHSPCLVQVGQIPDDG